MRGLASSQAETFYDCDRTKHERHARERACRGVVSRVTDQEPILTEAATEPAAATAAFMLLSASPMARAISTAQTAPFAPTLPEPAMVAPELTARVALSTNTLPRPCTAMSRFGKL